MSRARQAEAADALRPPQTDASATVEAAAQGATARSVANPHDPTEAPGVGPDSGGSEAHAATRRQPPRAKVTSPSAADSRRAGAGAEDSHSPTPTRSSGNSAQPARKRRRSTLLVALVGLAIVGLSIWFFTKTGTSAAAKKDSSADENRPAGSGLDAARPAGPNSELSGAGH